MVERGSECLLIFFSFSENAHFSWICCSLKVRKINIDMLFSVEWEDADFWKAIGQSITAFPGYGKSRSMFHFWIHWSSESTFVSQTCLVEDIYRRLISLFVGCQSAREGLFYIPARLIYHFIDYNVIIKKRMGISRLRFEKKKNRIQPFCTLIWSKLTMDCKRYPLFPIHV